MSFATDGLVTDGVSRALHSALNGVALRQSTIADNIANVDTPGYRARAVAFEDSLRSALDAGAFDVPGADPVVATSAVTATPVGPDGNSVDLRKETLAAVQSQFQYQMLTRAVSDKFDLVRTAVTGQ